MKIRQLLIIISISIGLSSCDCYVSVKGKILSSSTQKPIAGVTIKMIDRNIESTSNEEGLFLVEEQTGFCYDPHIEFTKKDYKPFLILITSGDDHTSYQVKSESESVNFDKPIYPDTQNQSTFVTGTWIENYSQNFKRSDDSLIIYLDENNIEAELNSIKKKLKK